MCLRTCSALHFPCEIGKRTYPCLNLNNDFSHLIPKMYHMFLAIPMKEFAYADWNN